MKLAKCLSLALATVVMLASCQQQTESPLDPGAKKSVSITIKNLSTSPETRVPTTDVSTGSIPVADMDDLWVMFADASGNIISVEEDPLVFSLADTNLDKNGNTFTFHELPATVQQVAVTNVSTPTTRASFTAVTTALDGMALSPDLQGAVLADMTGIPVYGEDLSFELRGEDTHDNVTYNYYASEVTVMPRLARIEIGSIGCTDLDAFTLDGETGELATYSPFGTLVLSRVGIDKTSLTTIGGTAVTYATDSAAGAASFQAAGWNVDAISPTATISGTTKTFTGGNDVFVFNVAPVYVPRVILEISGGTKNTHPDLAETNPAFGWPRYVRTTSLNDADGEITSFAPGHVYKVSLQFASSNVRPWYEDDTLICVDVEVTIPTWTIIDTTATFE